VAVGLQCLFIFHITGALMPDTLWVMNGYPRGGQLVNRQTLAGLYSLLLGSSEGLLVYSPVYALAIPGVVALYQRSAFAFWLTVAMVLPYLLVAASHDQGGAGGWSPAARYMVPVAPVLVLWIARWLGGSGSQPSGLAKPSKEVRWGAFFVGVAASFWIAQGMLAERHFPYDRQAYLSAGIVQTSAALGALEAPEPAWQRAVYPIFLGFILMLVIVWERREWPASIGRLSAAIIGLVLVMGSTSLAWSRADDWIGKDKRSGPVRLRPGRQTIIALPSCPSGSPRPRFKGTGGPHAVRVAGPSFVKHLVVPSRGEAELAVSVDPFLRIRSGSRERIELIHLELGKTQRPLDVETICR
jgi:hypothetical protein